MGLSFALGSSALLPAGLGFRNLLINGEFRINQRGYASASNLASGSYGFDRWKSSFTNTTLTFTSASQGQIVTINSGGSIKQIIERENVSAGTYILSWTGTATGRVYNTGATPPSYAASPLFVTLDGLANVDVEFTASGGTQTLWKPQLEANYQATPFEQRPIGVELALCQRYYQRRTGTGSTTYTSLGGFGAFGSSTAADFDFVLPVVMRVVPHTLDYHSASGFVGSTSNASYTSTSLGIQTVTATAQVFAITLSGMSGTAGLAVRLLVNNSTSGYLGWSAEL
jgi:hypothetical protein